MSLPRYPRYKSSCIDWAVELPAHWGTASLKWLCQRYSGGTPDKNRPEYWEGGTIPWLNSGAVNHGRIYEPSAFVTQAAFENSSAKWIPSGALVMALAGQGRTKGMVAQLMIESTCNQSMAAIVLNERKSARFIYWWLVGNYQNIRNMAGGDLRDGLNLDLLGAIPCPLPPLIEQSAIAAFLDGESAKIDALITEQEKLLTLLAEKRRAAISHAVTRGLKPNVPMQESGVAWLGVVPAHWKIVRLGQLFRESVESGDESLPILSVSIHDGVSDKELDDNELDRKVTRSDDRSKYKKVMCGDLVYNMMRAWQGGFGTVQTAGMVSPAYVVARPINDDFLSVFVEQLLRTPQGAQEAKRYSRGVTDFRLRLYWDEFKNIKIPLPPLREQQDIMTSFGELAAYIDGLVEQAGRAIDLLKERRSALISAAVTGKIDVRTVMPQELAA
jgi:type I restriction enzyme S subunit